MTLGLAILGAVLLLALLFFTSLADAALRAINQVRLRSLLEEGVGRAEAMDRLLDHPRRITSTTQVVNTFALAALAAITVLIAVAVSPTSGSSRLFVTAVVLILGLVVIIFGQLVPRSLALRNPERTAVRITRPLTFLHMLVSPITWGAERLANGVLGLFGVRDAPRNPYITEDDFRAFVNTGEAEGVLEEEERDMINSILRFADRQAHEVMVPRPDVVAVPDNLTARQALDRALRAGYSRVPLYADSIDNVEGILYTKDLMRAIMSPGQRPLKELAREAFFIPETKPLGELLDELRETRVHMAIVGDEYGGMAGIVTIEDLLEQIVGEIQDEYDVEIPDIAKVGPDEWIILGRTDLDEVNAELNLELNSEEYDSLGGFITAQLERLPEAGDEVEAQGFRMRVLDTEGRRTGRVAVSRVEPLPEPAGDDG